MINNEIFIDISSWFPMCTSCKLIVHCLSKLWKMHRFEQKKKLGVISASLFIDISQRTWSKAHSSLCHNPNSAIENPNVTQLSNHICGIFLFVCFSLAAGVGFPEWVSMRPWKKFYQRYVRQRIDWTSTRMDAVSTKIVWIRRTEACKKECGYPILRRTFWKTKYLNTVTKLTN